MALEKRRSDKKDGTSFARPSADCGRASREKEAAESQQLARLAIPRRGHVLSTVAEYYGEPLRKAAAALGDSFARKQCGPVRDFLFPPATLDAADKSSRSSAQLAAWDLVAVWTVAIGTKALEPKASLAEAEDWFFGPQASERLTPLASKAAVRTAEAALRERAGPGAYFELLPYILDPHGPGSRLSVRRNPATRGTRTRKRCEGIFYTPADVAEYMAAACIGALDPVIVPAVFDPACGTGVFLRAALSVLREKRRGENAFRLAADRLHGTDIDPWAADAAAFVLLADSLPDLPEGISPAKAWRELRRNMACIDTLSIDPEGTKNGSSDASGSRIALARLFPKLGGGATVILGNPPYADLGSRANFATLADRLESVAAKPSSRAEIYLAFIEQMIRLAASGECAGALVLPLSIACNVGTQFTAVRKLIARTPGEWRFAFFDREPHALFGEDVKTRNAIVFWSRKRSDKTATIATGPLRKWRGDSRAAMFRALSFTPIAAQICRGVPKIEGGRQSAALSVLSRRWNRLEDAVGGIERIALSATPDANDCTVFVGPTAYNFLNVFLAPPRGLLHGGLALSEHPLHVLRCGSPQNAVAVFAILSSHLSYWWWHAQEDGFHVSRRFLAELPFGPEAVAQTAGSRLAAAGAELWSEILGRPIISLNRGRTSLAFTPNGHDGIRRKADQVLADLAGLEPAFVEELQYFTARSVSATLHETPHELVQEGA